MNFEISDKSTEIQSTWDDARLYCFSLGGGWRLPTKEELNEIYESENDFEKGWYWSSSEVDYHYADLQYFGDGDQQNTYKEFEYYVRAIRDKDNS